ncbi:methyltransferase, FkbM family [Devosia sp. LC5]|uniref:FkbM family methyltransferase n=1 Tax=Devosia sp. LC5 TaxID=1502724 RepID=UPI0004E45AB2|nr:FkbM family methyltransferase [Devosia sp. LC5]KFC64551.1 methyltransferase, FkbM family [Devosia sp. LC5]
MTFTSYAQNFEDVILWRALKHVDVGFYIDIGAQDPIKDSVSRGFYEQGWRGVHVEANPFYSERLRKNRPDEDVLEVAVDRQEGEIAFFDIAETGLSTGDTAVAREHEAQGRHVTEVVVKSCPLSVILKRFRDRDIHWLKIDVEGMEEAVIDGWLPSDVRPWIVVIESTLPGTQEPSSQLWEPKLLSLGYEFAYFDGLNRFFVSLEKLELKTAFGAGPNVFDSFILADTSDFIVQNEETGHSKIAVLEREARRALETRIEEQRELLSTARQQLQAENFARLAVESELSHLARQLDALTASRSWRITAPLRVAVDAMKWFSAGAYAWLTLKPGTRPRRMARRLAVNMGRQLLANPKLARRSRRLASMLPSSIQAKLRSMIKGAAVMPPIKNTIALSVTDTSELPARAKEIYALLLIEQRDRKVD